MPRQGTKGQLYTFAEIIAPKDQEQENRDNLRIASLKRDIQSKNFKSAHDKLAAYGQWALLRMASKDPEIMAFCKRPEMTDIWKNWLAKSFSGYFGLPLENTSLFDLYLGHYIFEFYGDYEKENLINDPAAQELMAECCKRLVYPALQWRCANACECLRNNNEEAKTHWQDYLDYAKTIANAGYYSIGYLDAAMLCFKVGSYLTRLLDSKIAAISFFRPSKLSWDDSIQKLVYGINIAEIQANVVMYLDKAEELFSKPETRSALQVAFCRDNITSKDLFTHFDLPDFVHDFATAKQYFIERLSKYSKLTRLSSAEHTHFFSPAAA